MHTRKWLSALALMVAVAALVLAGCGSKPSVETVQTTPQADSGAKPAQPGRTPSAKRAKGQEEAMPEYKIVTLLPPDAIPAIFDPTFLPAEQADSQYDPDELVLGVEINGDVRAYSIPHLSGHEIVNDVVGGQPIAVTW